MCGLITKVSLLLSDSLPELTSPPTALWNPLVSGEMDLNLSISLGLHPVSRQEMVLSGQQCTTPNPCR